MFDYGDGRPDGVWGILMGIGWSITAFIGFLIWLAIIALLVRFLLIATRAAKLYLSQNGEDAGLFPRRPVPPTAPAPASTARTTATAPTTPGATSTATAPTKPTTRPRKPTTGV
jgi:hypothetical protein